jgi:hypothetical protein
MSLLPSIAFFCCYWPVDVGARHKIPFVVGHAPYIKAIPCGNTKNGKTDSFTIAALLGAAIYPFHMPIRQK